MFSESANYTQHPPVNHRNKKADDAIRHLARIWLPLYALSIFTLFPYMVLVDIKLLGIPVYNIIIAISIAFSIPIIVTIRRMRRAPKYTRDAV